MEDKKSFSTEEEKALLESTPEVPSMSKVFKRFNP